MRFTSDDGAFGFLVTRLPGPRHLGQVPNPARDTERKGKQSETFDNYGRHFSQMLCSRKTIRLEGARDQPL